MVSALEIVITAVALSMDAFSVSISKGLSCKKFDFSYAIIIALFFAVFQAVMPFIGYLIVKLFEFSKPIQDFIGANTPIIAFVLLAFIGIKMLIDVLKSSKKNNEVKSNKIVKPQIKYGEIIALSIATSIDALMVGFAYSVMQINIFVVVLIIGLVTFAMCVVGVAVGCVFGSRWEKPAVIVGACVLLLLALKYLLQFFAVIKI